MDTAHKQIIENPMQSQIELSLTLHLVSGVQVFEVRPSLGLIQFAPARACCVGAVPAG